MQKQKKGRGKRTAFPKGRVLDEAALAEIRQLLGDAPMRRDLLIEHLHKIQDHYGFLEARHMRALAELMRLSQAEVYEVASFYHHFTIVKEGEALPPTRILRVCDSLSCQLAGAEELIQSLRDNPVSDVRIERAPCMGACDKAPAAQFGKRPISHASGEQLRDVVASGKTEPELPNYRDLASYRADGGYTLFEDLQSGKQSIQGVIDSLSSSGLRGLGGAGFPAGRKWSIVKSYDGPRLMTINGDEGEPGTFKDRHYLSNDPHRMIEGALIAAHCVEAEGIYFYLRDEYPELHEVIKTEIAALENAGLIARGFFHLRRGAGAYICGEESAMLESIEGKRGLPRHRPPYIAEVGLFGRPTLNHNVETLYWVRDIVEKGADWFIQQGKDGHPGLRSYSVSGRVAKPGVVLAPAGSSLRELIEQHCGGMADGHQLKAFLPGGASGGILPASFADEPLDFGVLEQYGAFVGSHAVVVLSDQDSIRDAVLNLMSFFEHESCGQCTPCRSGTQRIVDLLSSQRSPDRDLLSDLADVMQDASICGLGQAAPNPLRHLMQHFAEELS